MFGGLKICNGQKHTHTHTHMFSKAKPTLSVGHAFIHQTCYLVVLYPRVNFAIKIIFWNNETNFHKKYEAKGVENQKHNYHNLQIWIISLLINDHIIVDHEEIIIIILNLVQRTNFWN